MNKKSWRKIELSLVFVCIFCLVLTTLPAFSTAQTDSSPIKITELTCDKTVLAPGENATVKVYMKNVGHDHLDVFGELSVKPNGSFSIQTDVGFGSLLGDHPDYVYYMVFYVINTGEFSQDTKVTITAHLTGMVYSEGSKNMTAADLAQLPELASDTFTLTLLKGNSQPLEASPTSGGGDFPVWVLVVVIAVILICVSIYVYKRRKKDQEPKT